ncbi:MAG: T9SS type A sorting domain-containing protein [Bacilli bacterium]
MKKLLIILIISLIPILGFAQRPISKVNKQFFPPCWNEPEWTFTFSTLAIYTNWGKVSIIDKEKNIEFPLKLGDWVGAFCVDLDGSLKCCGANQWLYEDQNLGINLVADEPSTPHHKEGFYEDEEIIIKIYRWDIYDEFEADYLSFKCYPGDPLYDCDGLFNNGQLYVLDTVLINENIPQQTILLNSGWSTISSYLKPIDRNIEIMFSEIFENMIILKNLYGNVYWNLRNGQSINTLNNWWLNHGFNIKMLNSDTLKIYGYPYEEDQIDLEYENQWAIMPVPYDNIYEVEKVFASLVNQPTGIVKYQGFVYWPYYGINTLYYIDPGKGYMIHVENFTIPNFEITKKESKIQNRSTTNYWNTKETESFNIILIENIQSIMEIDEQLGVFDNTGSCYGSTIYNGGENLAIIAYGDDPNTNYKDGFYNNERLNFKILDINKDLIDFEPYLFENSFTGNNKIIYGKVLSNQVNIEYDEPEFEIVNTGSRIEIRNSESIEYYLYDTSGQLIQQGKTNNDIEINRRNQIYILNIITKYYSYTYKIL